MTGRVGVWLLAAGFTVGMAACARPDAPASPGPVPSVPADQGGGESLIGVQGLIRGLDVEARSFTLVTRGGSYVVRTDGRTQIWNAGREVRFATLATGMTVGVRAVDRGRTLLARSIGILSS
jgi:hypothetical protein